MKRFYLSPATLTLITLATIVTVLIFYPNTLGFASIWDNVVLRVYDATRFYHVFPYIATPLLIAGLIWYVLSRDPLWRYRFNFYTITFIHLVRTILPIIDWLYHRLRGVIRPIVVRIAWSIAYTIPFWRNTDTQAKMDSELVYGGFITPNRRYLAAVRQHLDTIENDWIKQLQTRVWHDQNLRSRDWNAALWHQRAWNAQMMMKYDGNRAIPEVTLSTIVMMQQWLTLAHCHYTLTDNPEKYRTQYQELFDTLSDLLNREIDNSHRADILDHLRILQSWTDPSDTVTFYQAMQSFDTMLTRYNIPEGALIDDWSTAIMKRQVVLHLEWLVRYGYHEVALDVVSQTADLFDGMIPHAEDDAFAFSQQNPIQQFRTRITLDRPPLARRWHILMASPHHEDWYHHLIAEAEIGYASHQITEVESIPDDNKQQGTRLLEQRYSFISGYRGFNEAGTSQSEFAREKSATLLHRIKRMVDIPLPSAPTGKYNSPIKTSRLSPREYRTLIIGKAIPLSQERAGLALRFPVGWRFTDDFAWRQTLLLLITGIAFGLSLVIIQIFYQTPDLTYIADARITRDYHDSDINAVALTKSDWLLLGTDGDGIHAYHTASSAMGLWRTYDTNTTNQGLLSDFVVDIATGDRDVWYVHNGGGLSYSNDSFTQWQPIIGEQGFAPISIDAVLDARLSDDNRYLVVVARDVGLGIYDTRTHNWIQTIRSDTRQLQGNPVAIEWHQDHLFVATEEAISVFELQNGRLNANSQNRRNNVSVVRLYSDGDTLLAITENGGVLRFNQQWSWLIEEDALPLSTIDNVDVALVTDNYLWIAIDNLVGQYDLRTHGWRSSEPSSQSITQIIEHNDDIFVVSGQRVYQWQERDEWEAIEGDVAEIVSLDEHLFGVTPQGILADINTNSLTLSNLIGQRVLDTNTNLLDVLVIGNAYWFRTDRQGIVSYDWETRRWEQRGSDDFDVDTFLTNGRNVWALSDEKIYRFQNNDWVEVDTDDRDIKQIALVGDILFALTDSGTVINVSNTNAPEMFRTISNLPLTYDDYVQVNDDLHLTSEQGWFVYDTDTRSWSQQYSEAVVGIATDENAILLALPDRRLVDRNTREIIRYSTELGSSNTAITYQNQFYLGTSNGLFVGRNADDGFTRISSIASNSILQLREKDNSLLALSASSANRTSLHRTQGSSWQTIFTNQPITHYDYHADITVTRERDGLITIYRGDDEVTLFENAPSLSNLRRAMQYNGNLLILTENLYRYDAPTATWERLATNINDLQILNDGILYTTNRGTFLINSIGQDPRVINEQSSTRIIQMGTDTFVLSNGQIFQYNGGILGNVPGLMPLNQVTRTGTFGTIETAISDMIISSNNELWAWEGNETSVYQWDGSQWVRQGTRPIPTAINNGQFIAGDGNSEVYYGTAEQCQQFVAGGALSLLNNDRWENCDVSIFQQVTESIADPFGRFNWENMRLNARLSDNNTTIPNDVATGVVYNEEWLVETANGCWLLDVNTSRRIEFRNGVTCSSLSLPSQTIEQNNGMWRYIVTPSSGVESDSIQIRGATGTQRRISSGEFADHRVTDIAYIDDHFWMATEDGLWQLASPNSLTDRQLVEAIGTRPINTLVLSADTLYAVTQSGNYAYRNSVWVETGNIPDETVTQITDELGHILLDVQISNEELVLTNNLQTMSRRYPFDDVQSIVGTDTSLWLSTPVNLQYSDTSLQIDNILPNANLDLFSIDNVAYAANGDTFYQINVTELTQITNPRADSAFSRSAVANNPIRWQWQDETIRPIFNGGRVSITNGRFPFDVHNGLTTYNNQLYVATQSGVLSYDTQLNVMALPTPQHLNDSVTDIGVLETSPWVRIADNFYMLNHREDNIQLGNRIRTPFANGANYDTKWTNTLRPLNESALSVPALENMSVFSNGRFRFDNVIDAAINNQQLMLTTDVGVMIYPNLSLQEHEQWFTTLDAQRVSYGTEGMAWVLQNEIPYQLENLRWSPVGTSDVFYQVGASFTITGWQPIRYNPVTAKPITIHTIGDPKWTDNGRFTFDNVRRVAAQGDVAWLLTDEGWVRVVSQQNANGIALFNLMSDRTNTQPIRDTYVSDDNRLVGLANNVAIEWEIANDTLGQVTQQSLTPSRILSASSGVTIDGFIYLNAADWLLPFDQTSRETISNYQNIVVSDQNNLWFIANNRLYHFNGNQ